MQAILNFSPERGITKTLLDDAIQGWLVARAVQAQPVRNVFVYRFWEWIRPLKNHPHPLSQFNHVDVRMVNIMTSDVDGSFDANIIDEIVHSIEAAQQSGFSTTGWPDERGHDSFLNGQGDVSQRAHVTIMQRQVTSFDKHAGSGWLRFRDQ